MSGSSAVAGQPSAAPPPEVIGRGRGWRQYLLTGGFLAPAAILLGVWVVYPTIRTIIRSFYDRDGSTFVWFDNYKEIFTSDILLTAVKNNLLWVAVVPALVVSVGLVFAVLMERVSWAVAFRTAVFMPMAISAFAAGITWRIVYQQDPNLGVANAMISRSRASSRRPACSPGRCRRVPASCRRTAGSAQESDLNR